MIRWDSIYTPLLIVVILHLATSLTSHVLPSLTDIDFQRVRADQLHTNNGEVVFPSLASFSRDLVGNGFHRELVTTIQLVGIPLNSRVLLVENITGDIYMDIDQVKIAGMLTWRRVVYTWSFCLWSPCDSIHTSCITIMCVCVRAA